MRVPPDVIVNQRIQTAARYAAIEGGLSARAYTASIADGAVNGLEKAMIAELDDRCS